MKFDKIHSILQFSCERHIFLAEQHIFGNA
jgi:hypothetical protein